MDVSITGGSIKLGQFLKLANLAESGGRAKELISSGEVDINGEVVTSRGYELVDGDVVSIPSASLSATVLADGGNSGDSGDDYFDERTANDDFDPEKWRNL